MRPLTEQQALHAVDSEQLYEAWLANRRRVLEHRHGMRWVRSGGKEYLVRVTDAQRNGRSLGPRSPETERIFHEFQAAKARADEGEKKLRERMAQQIRLNKALRLGRAPALVGEILRELELRAAGEFAVVGAHALYGYEALAGAHMVTELLASGDVDLLVDGRKKLSILAGKLAPDGLIGLLRGVDKSFGPIAEGSFRAVNEKGFMVDFLVQPRDMRESGPIRPVPNDLVAAEIEGLQWLLNAPQVRTVGIAADGMPYGMRVPDPRVFALHKAWLSQRVDREPLKKGRDLAQARALANLIVERLPQFPLDPGFLASLPHQLRDRLPLLELGPDEAQIEAPSRMRGG